MDVRIISKNREWDNIVKRFSNSSFYHTASWKKLLEKHGCKGFLIVAEDGDSITGILPVYMTKSKLFHFREFRSIPFCNEDGLLITQKHDESIEFLLKGLKELTEKYSSIRTVLQTKDVLMSTAKVQPEYRYIFRTEGYSLKDVWNNILSKGTRKSVSRAINKGGVAIMRKRLSYFKEYYEMYKDVMRRRKTSIGKFSEQFFKDVFIICRKHLKIFTVEQNNRIISSTLCFHYNGVLHGWSLVSYTSSLKYRPNDLLIWEVIKWGIKNKCRYIEFGTVPVEGEVGLRIFKEKYKTDLEKTYCFEMNHSWKADFEDFIVSLGKNIKNRFF